MTTTAMQPRPDTARPPARRPNAGEPAPSTPTSPTPFAGEPTPCGLAWNRIGVSPGRRRPRPTISREDQAGDQGTGADPGGGRRPPSVAICSGRPHQGGLRPIVTADPSDVPRLMAEEKPHLALLDLVLPDKDGIELMNDILRIADVPVIFLSVYGQDETVARAFDMGAADYVVKPFSPTELAARIRAALRKRLESFSREPSERAYAADGLSIDFARRLVAVDGEPVTLTATEYALLYELAIHAPRVLTHSVLLQRVWGPERVGEAWLVRDVVKRLRQKLGDAAKSPRYILTEPRVGYRLAMGDTAEEDG